MRNFTFRSRHFSSTGGRRRAGNSTDGSVVCKAEAGRSSDGIVVVRCGGSVADKSNVAV